MKTENHQAQISPYAMITKCEHDLDILIPSQHLVWAKLRNQDLVNTEHEHDFL